MTKKFLSGLCVLAALSLSSCGEKLMTDAQVQAAIQQGVETGRAAVESEMDKVCEANFQARVQAEFEKFKADYEATKAAEMPAK
jgi:hypothetical protein